MKKTSVISVLAVSLTIFLGSISSQVRAESMNFKLISMVEKLETVQVSGVDNVVLGVLDRKGLSVFENGEIVTTECRSVFDTKKGFQGYSTLTFGDGSTVVVSWSGATAKPSPSSVYREYTAPFEYVTGTGRFKGIEGSGTFLAKAPNWDKAFKAKGFTYYEFTGTYKIATQ